ncbi:MAG: hypothetical protein JWO59_749 [Chloroflexi bacterium]|nr:hypothetical protein [Chloroflexota bacterium]
MTLLTPDADFTCVVTQDPVTGQLSAGFVLAPDGDLAVVSGMDRLLQDVTLELMIATGDNPFLPDQGSDSGALVGRVIKDPTSVYVALMAQVEQKLVARHEADMTAGHRTKQAALDHIRVDNVDATSQLGAILVTYTVASASGAETQQILGFATGGS